MDVVDLRAVVDVLVEIVAVAVAAVVLVPTPMAAAQRSQLLLPQWRQLPPRSPRLRSRPMLSQQLQN